MSCGNPHATGCDEVHRALMACVDCQLDDQLELLLQQHFDECPPCLSAFYSELLLKFRPPALGAAGHVPDDLYTRVAGSYRVRAARWSAAGASVSFTEVSYTEVYTEAHTEVRASGPIEPPAGGLV